MPKSLSIIIFTTSLGVFLGSLLAYSTPTIMHGAHSSWRQRYAPPPVTAPYAFGYAMPIDSSPDINYILPSNRGEVPVQPTMDPGAGQTATGNAREVRLADPPEDLSGDSPLDAVAEYCGSHVAFYFAFLKHYIMSVRASVCGVWCVMRACQSARVALLIP